MGAETRNVMRLVLAHGLRLTALGVGIGLAGALILMRLIEGLLFGITPTDAPTFASVAGLLAAIALAASYVPARRAAQVDPMTALRHD